MDLLRNLGSAAASSLLQKSGISLPYSLGDRITEYDGKSIWTLYDATKKDDSSPVSVFHFDSSTRRNQIPLAKNALRKLRTTRHPDILKFYDVVEQGDTLWIMTERVRPLRGTLFAWDDSSNGGKGKNKEAEKARTEWTIWGLHRIVIALAFLNDTCASTHGNLTIDSVFLAPSGEWRLGGFELLSTTKDDNPVLFTLGSQFPQSSEISSPEVQKSGFAVLRDLPAGPYDAYSLGILLNTVFNLTTTPPPTVHPPHTQPTAASRGHIPALIFPVFKKLLNPNPKTRTTVQAFLDAGMGEGAASGSGGWFVDNHLVKVCNQLEGFPLASEHEKSEFLSALKESAQSFPPEFAVNRVVPSLFSSLERGGASAAVVVPLIFELARLADPDPSSSSLLRKSTYRLSPSEYSAKILAPIVKLYASPDRGTRMALLEMLPEYESKLDGKMVGDIWTNLQTGFADTVPVIREATIRAVSLIAPKLSSRVLNNDLLRHLARSQSDPEPSIRTNTCILIAKLAPTLSSNTRKKVLVPAFLKAIKDPFVHARVASIAGLMACSDHFDTDDVANRVLGVIGGALIDREKIVRDPAFKCLDLYRKRLEEHAASLPDTALSTDSGVPNGVVFASAGGQATILSSATGAAGSLAGWAFSSISSKLMPGDLNTTMATANVSASTPPTPAPTAPKSSVPISTPSPAPSTKSLPPTSNGARPARGTSKKGKGMNLGSKLGGKGNLTAGQSTLLAELESEMAAADTTATDAWDDEPYGAGFDKSEQEKDLMDVNADQDDWTAFESAPTPSIGVVSPAVENAWSTSTKSPPLASTASAAPVVPDNPWSNSGEDISSVFSKPATYPSLSTQSTLQPKQPSSLNISTSVSPPADDGWAAFGEGEAVDVEKPSPATPAATPSGNLAGMSKEEKAAEMARRREERKARIAQLKEQKKGGT